MTHDRRGTSNRIVRDPAILVGKPVVKGTRIPVARVLGHLAHTPDFTDFFAAYPELTIDDVKACFAYAQAAVEAKRAAKDDLAPVPPVHA